MWKIATVPVSTYYTSGFLRQSSARECLDYLGIYDLNQNAITGPNFISTNVKWVDALTSGISVLGVGPAAPAPVSAGGGVQGMGYAHGGAIPANDDTSYFTIQTHHSLATLSASFPQFYYEPHIHVSPTVAPVVGVTDRCTFTMEWQVAIINGVFATHTLTAFVDFTAQYQTRMLTFGNVVNNNLAGQNSVIFRGRISRNRSALRDIAPAAATRNIIVDSIDFHVPVRQLGSLTI